MGFRTGAKMTIWSIEDKGGYANVNISSSKKNKQTNEYETDWSGYARFIGDAKELVQNMQRKDKITILDCEVTTYYQKSTGKTFTNYAVFSAEIPEGYSAAPMPSSSGSADDFMNIPEGIEDELPFQ